MRLLATNMQEISALASCIGDPQLQRQFLNLVNGVSPRYD